MALETTGTPAAATAGFVPPTKAWAARRTAEVLARGVVERIRRGQGTNGIPRSAEDLTCAYLSSVLFPHDPQARVLEIRRPGGSVGTTTRSALDLTYNEAGQALGVPNRLFVKCTTALAQRLILGLGGFIDGEPGFYNLVRPQIEIEAPRAYHCAVDPRSWRSISVMEDVAALRGAKFWQPSTTMTRARMEDLLANTAVWHGSFWNSPKLNDFRWLKTPAQHLQVIDAFIGMEKRSAVGTRRSRAVLPDGLWRRRADLYAGMRRSLEISSRGAHTYLHGDYHVGNTYVTKEGRMGIGDWQIGVRGSWVYDYAYIITTGLEVEDRRAWEHDLLDFYLERLATNGGPALSHDKAFTAYREATFYPYFAWAYTIGRHALMPKYQPDEISLPMMQRTGTAIDDLESLRAVGL
ncbi:MAG: phosphotransferase [Sporichthyaceae bacterium]